MNSQKKTKAQLIHELQETRKSLQDEVALRRLIELELQNERYTLETLLDNIPDYIFIKNDHSKIVINNSSHRKLLGEDSLEKVVGKDDFDFFNKELASQYYQDEQEILKTGKPLINHEETAVSKDGTRKWLLTTKIPIKDTNDQFSSLVGISRDITQIKKAEIALRESEDRFRSIIQDLTDIVFVLDARTKIRFVTPSSMRILGYTPEDLIGTIGLDLIHPDDIMLVQNELNMVLKGERSYTPTVVRCRHKNRQWVHLDIVGSNMLDHPGVMGLIVTARDVSDRIKAEQLVSEMVEELKDSNQDLEQFAYAISHDLQEPLRKVKSFSELLSHRFQGKLDDKADSYISYIVDGSTRMQSMIQDLLTYSRISTRGNPFNLVDIRKCIDEALANLAISVEKTGASIIIDNTPKIKADSGQMIRLFQNLIENAIKFRGIKPPAVTISAIKENGIYQFSVSDNGIGLDPKHAERIFQVFQRLHTREEYEGTGIGLALCKRIVDRHGGKIWVESEPGKGTTFYFTLSRKN